MIITHLKLLCSMSCVLCVITIDPMKINTKTIKIWNPNSGALLYTLTGHTIGLMTLATLPNGNLASGSADSTVKIWNPNTGSLLCTLSGHKGYVWTLATLTNGNLASGSVHPDPIINV
jgi:WD40 repeat protein